MNIKEIQEKIAPTLKAYGVMRAGLFGSVARGEDSPNSDIDILVKFHGPKTLLDLVGLEYDLARLLNKKVDLVTEGSLNPHLKDLVLKDLRIFYGT